MRPSITIPLHRLVTEAFRMSYINGSLPIRYNYAIQSYISDVQGSDTHATNGKASLMMER